MTVRACNPCIREVEMGGLGVQGLFFGYTELEANLGYWRVTNNLSHSDRCLEFTGYTEECHRMVGMFSASWVRDMWI